MRPIFELEGGFRVHVFARERPSTAAEIAAFGEKLRRHYPDRPQIYAP